MAYSNSEVLDVLDEMPHGGGERYNEEEGKLHPDAADVTVSTLSELSEAVGPDHVIHIDSDIEFGSTEIDVGRSTLVGDRGWDGSEGALLSTGVEGHTGGGTDSDRPYTMLYSTATEGAPRITGLRLRGATTTPRTELRPRIGTRLAATSDPDGVRTVTEFRPTGS